MLLSAALLLLAISGVSGLILIYGSPHLRTKDGPQSCYYYGLNGREIYRTGKDTCPLIKFFPLD